VLQTKDNSVPNGRGGESSLTITQRNIGELAYPPPVFASWMVTASAGNGISASPSVTSEPGNQC
jgi:hypothetical protein